MELQGPPPDPREVRVEAPDTAWGLSFGVALLAGLVAYRWERLRLAFGALALTVGLTAPLLGMVTHAVSGSFPTIDKAGSLHFYRQGVHHRLLDLNDAGVQLIGVHLGHLWVVELWDLVLVDWAAFNATSLTFLWLSVWTMAAWLKPRTHWVLALALAVPFGLNLHQLRDVNWYTVEKTAVFLLPLWGMARRPVWATVVGALAMLINVYMGVLIAVWGAWEVVTHPRDRAVWLRVGATALGMLPFVVWQALLMRGAGAPGSPESFAGRAALDVVTLWPPAWNRLEAWRALSLVAVVLWVRRGPPWLTRGALGAGLALLLALGPASPLYAGLNTLVPGFWRIAKPESFFWLVWFAVLTAAAAPGRHKLWATLVIVEWLILVRSHPVFPDFFSAPRN